VLDEEYQPAYKEYIRDGRPRLAEVSQPEGPVSLPIDQASGAPLLGGIL
jgi:hypothetical protein